MESLADFLQKKHNKYMYDGFIHLIRDVRKDSGIIWISVYSRGEESQWQLTTLIKELESSDTFEPILDK